MGDSKPKRTISKLGKFFGMLSTNLNQVEKHSDEEEVKGVSEGMFKTGSSQTNGPVKGQALSPALSPEEPPRTSTSNSVIISQQENDYLSPLPLKSMASPKTSRSNTPTNKLVGSSTTTSPTLVSSSINDDSYFSINPKTSKIVHPQPQTITESNLDKINSSLNNLKSKSPTVSRTSSTTAPRKLTSSNPVSRSTSTKAKQPSITNMTPAPMSTASIPSSASTSNLPNNQNKPRFKMLENGLHEHNLRSAKRQEKLSNMLKDLLGAKKLRDEAKSEVPKILLGATAQPNGQQNKPPTLFAGLVNHIKNNTSPYHGGSNVPPAVAPIGETLMSGTDISTANTVNTLPNSSNLSQQDSRSFVQKYGRCQEVIGRGAFGVVRICHKKVIPTTSANPGQCDEVLYAVKEFKRKPTESDKKYNRRLTSEFCISSSLKHMNIIDTLDLLKDAKGDYCEVMEFCSGGDLYTLIIASGKLEYAEADCIFKQIIRGVNYMHDMGVSHRDLKPENVLLTQNGVVKITDFGNGECFRMAWEEDIQLSEGICGSSPYIAPEEFIQTTFDPRGVDIWACGVIYMAMRTGRQLWKLADPLKDEFFEEYLHKRKDTSGYEPIESLKRARCRNVIYSILDPKPERRINGKQILNSEWGREIKVCDAGEGRGLPAVQ